jgi:polyhydroxyalkanoate synthesis repressor PhaR
MFRLLRKKPLLPQSNPQGLTQSDLPPSRTAVPGELVKARPFLFAAPRLSFAAVQQKMGGKMAETDKPLLIKRYASRRLYNTETSDYVTLEDIAGFIRIGREVQIIDLKSGDDLTRQYLLQIVAEHESKGESVLPINVLTDLVRSYTTGMTSVVPQFLSTSFDLLRDGQSKMVENLTKVPSPLTAMPGFEVMRQQQEAFLKSMMAGGLPAWGGTGPAPEADKAKTGSDEASELANIKAQLAELQSKLSKM